MPRKPQGDRALTIAERAARNRQRKAERDAAVVEGLAAIQHARTIREARQIAADVAMIMEGKRNARGTPD